MVIRRFLIVACLVVTVLAVTAERTVAQVEAEATPLQDTFIRHARPDEVYGFSDVMLSGNSTIESNWRTDALMQFELPPEPEGQEVVHAELDLFNNQLEWANRGNADFGAMAIMFEWSEEDDTWSTLDADFADYGETVYDVVTFEGIDPPFGEREDLFPEEWRTWEITELVQAWYDGSIENNGVAINGMVNFGDDSGAELFPQFRTKDYFDDEELWPTLRITFDSVDPLAPLDDGSLTDLGERTDYVHDVLNTWLGDSNLDGEFNSADFVLVFTAGEYEDDIEGNSTWATGDWDGDMDFNSSDFVAAFSDGGYEQGPRPNAAVAAVPEPATLIGSVICFLWGVWLLRRES